MTCVRLLLLALCCLAGSARAVDGPRATLQLEPCTLPQLNRPARCGSLEVPENPEQTGGRLISIGVAVLPAAPGPALADPIAVLMGGPGEDAISAASIFAGQFARLLRDRDLLLVDQRGTGRSNALSCNLYQDETPAVVLRDLYPPHAIRRCARQLESRADLAQYSVARFANDLERVRLALGYGPLNLTAGSYGTRSAQVFVRSFPKSVRTVHLASVVPLDIPPPLTMAKSTQSSLESLFADCEADLACRTAFPKLRVEFLDLVARLDSGPVRVSIPGVTRDAVLDRGRVVEWIRSQLYRPTTAAGLPWLIHRAHAGDWLPITEGIRAYAAAFSSAASAGVFFSVTCSEDLAFVSEQDIQRESRGTFLGDYRVRQQKEACRQWPRAALPEGFRSPVRSSVPALFVSGDTDAASPLWFTRHVAQGFANRAEVVLRGRGHTEWSDCLATVLEQFIRTGQARGLDTSGCQPVPRPPFRTH